MITRFLIASAALTAVLGVAGCGGGSSKQDPPQPATVAELIAQFEDAYQAKDAAAIAALCTYPFEMDGVAVGSAATFEQFLQTSFDAAGDYQVAELLGPVIQEEGDTVTVTGSFHVIDTTHGESSEAVTITGVRVDGVWKANGFSRAS